MMPSPRHPKCNWPYQPRFYGREPAFVTPLWNNPNGRYLGSGPAPQMDACKHSPGKDGTGEFPEDGLQCA